MWYLWLIFALLAVLIPVWILFMASKAAKPYSNDKQKMKIISLNAIKYILFYWLCDLFLMSCIIDNLACKYIFGGSIMLIVFYNLSNAFANSKVKRNGLIKWGMLQDFIVGVGLSIYLIYIIPNTDLREIVSVIIAAVYGGLLTLVGVAWTIIKGESERKEDEQNRVKPFWGVVDNLSTDVHRASNNFKIFSKKNMGFASGKHLFNLQNSDKCSFFIDKLSLQGEEYFPETRCLIKKDEIFSIGVYMEQGKQMNRQEPIRVFVTDMNYENHIYEISVNSNGKNVLMEEVTNE